MDHDDVEFKISHKIVTEDTIFATKASQSPMFAVLTVTDDDAVGIGLKPNVLTLQESGVAKSLTFVGLKTKPVASVKVQVEAGPHIGVDPKFFYINENDPWKDINKPLFFEAKDALSTTARIVCSSDDANNVTSTDVSVVVQPLLQALNIPAEGALKEGKLFAYKLSLSAVPSESVKIQLTMQGDCTLLTLSLNLHDTTETTVKIEAPNNFVDEGDNVIAYTCNISHTLNSTDSAYHGQVHMIQLSVLNDDVADVKVAAYSPDLHGFAVSTS